MTREQTHEFFSEHIALSERLYGRYTREQIELLLAFVREGREFNERQAELLERRNRARHEADRKAR